METEYIGNMIAYERNRRGLTAEVVHRGICEQSVYSRIENGNYTGDIHLVMSVLGRLGISGSKAGRYLCRDEYDEMQARFNVLEYIRSADLEKIEIAIKEYSDKYCDKSRLNEQFVVYMQARLLELRGETLKALEMYSKAAGCTMPDYISCDSFMCISLYEYFIIANVARLKAATGNKEESISLYEKLLAYCKKNDIDKWIITCIYPKTVYEILCVNTPQMMGNYARHRWLEECDEALKVLRDTSRVHFLCPLLKKRQVLLKVLGMDDDVKWDIFLKRYEWLRKRYDIGDNLFEWYPYYIGCAFYPVERLIDERRRIHGLTVQELAEGICSPETVSRIINRKVSPKYSTTVAMLDNVGLKGALWERVIVSKKPEVHRLWDTLVQCNLHSDYITAQEIYKILSNELSSSIEINEMVLKYKKVELDEAVGNVNYQKSASDYERMLGFHIGDINKITIFTDIEAMIINAYFGCMDRLGNYDNLSIYENLCKVFADRDRMNRGMAGIYESILVRCANYVGNMGQYLRSNDYSEQGIRLELECERTHVLSTFLYCIPWNNVTSGKRASEEDIELCECAYQFAWYLRENKRMIFYRKWIDNNKKE